jgi:hypothetical protein
LSVNGCSEEQQSKNGAQCKHRVPILRDERQ